MLKLLDPGGDRGGGGGGGEGHDGGGCGGGGQELQKRRHVALLPRGPQPLQELVDHGFVVHR